MEREHRQACAVIYTSGDRCARRQAPAAVPVRTAVVGARRVARVAGRRARRLAGAPRAGPPAPAPATGRAHRRELSRIRRGRSSPTLHAGSSTELCDSPVTTRVKLRGRPRRCVQTPGRVRGTPAIHPEARARREDRARQYTRAAHRQTEDERRRDPRGLRERGVRSRCAACSAHATPSRSEAAPREHLRCTRQGRRNRSRYPCPTRSGCGPL